jgi:hypothetical protein
VCDWVAHKVRDHIVTVKRETDSAIGILLIAYNKEKDTFERYNKELEEVSLHCAHEDHVSRLGHDVDLLTAGPFLRASDGGQDEEDMPGALYCRRCWAT